MVNVILTIHLLIAIGMIALILMQKSEGNSAGGGFSQTSVTAMMQPRARPNALSRATTILGFCFFATSLGLALIAKNGAPTTSIVDAPGAAKSGEAPKVTDIIPEQKPAETAPATTPAETPAPAAPAVPNQ